MTRLSRQIRSYWHQLLIVMRNEYRTIFTDAGVLLILVLAIFIYATLYSSAYGAQVLRNVPIGVVDECRTPTSRSLIDLFNAGPNTYVAYEPTDMEAARRLFFDRKIYGIVYIPSDYERHLLGGEQANVAIYVDASYFLMYRQVFQEVVTSIGATGAMVEFQRLVAKGANIPQAQATTQPVIYESHNLFNPYLGYGTFVMPAIIMVIIQQTLLIGIGMIGGTWREFGLYTKLCPEGRCRLSTLPVVMGKGLVDVALHPRTALPAVPLPDERCDGNPRALHGSLPGGLHRHGHRRLDPLPLPRKFAAAVALDLNPLPHAERRFVPRRGDSRVAARLRADSPLDARRQWLHPHPEHGGFACGGAARNQDALHPHAALRRSGLHQHPSGHRTRMAHAAEAAERCRRALFVRRQR